MTEETNRGENFSEYTRKRLAAMLPTAADKVIFFVGAAVTLAGIIGMRVAENGWVVFFDNVHWTAAYLTGAALAWLGAGALATEGTNKSVRRWVALGLSANCIGQILWDIQVYTGWNPFPGPSDAFFLLLAPGIIAGYYTAFHSHTLQFNKKSVWLDSIILSGAMIIITFALYLARRGETPLYQFAVLAAYPIVLLSAAALGILLILHGRLRLSVSQILFYLSVVASGWMWLEWNSRTLDGLLADGVWFNTVFSCTTIVMGIGARHWCLEVSTDEKYRTFCDNVLRYLPLAAVVAACSAIVLSFSMEVPSSVRTLIVFGAGSIVLLAAVRQSVIVMDLRNANMAVEEARQKLEQYSISLERTITEQEKTERHRRRQNEILEKTSDFVGSIGMDRRVTFLNAAFKKHFGIAESDDVSAFTPSYFHPPDVFEYLTQTANPHAIEHGIWSGEATIWNKDKTGTIPVSQVILPHYSETGELEWLSTIMRDLTAQKQSEQETEKQRQFLQGVFQGMSNVGLMVFTVEEDDFRLAGINKWYEDRGVKAEQYMGRTLTEIDEFRLLSAATIINTRRRLNLSLEMRREYTEEAEIGTSNGYFSTTTIPIMNESDGAVTMIIVTTIDITERKNIERFLRGIVEQTSSVVGQKFFEAMVEFLAKTLKVKYAFVGKLTDDGTAVQTLAVCIDNKIGANMRYDLAGTPCANVMEREVCVYNGGVQELFPTDTLLQEMGAESYVGVPLLSSDMAAIGIIVVMDNKSLTTIEFVRSAMSIFAARASSEIDRMDAEDKLRKEQEYIRYIVDSSPVLICGIAANGTTLFVNPALQTVTGYTPEEVLGKNWFEMLYPGEEAAQVQQLLTDITAIGVLTDYPMELRTKSGELRTVLWNGSVVRTSDGGLQHIIGIGNDITEKKRMEANRMRLESLEREKRAVELRGALQNIGQLQGSLREIISEIARNTEHALGAGYGSYWEIHDSGAECLLCYGRGEKGEVGTETGQWLHEHEYPQYFAMMRSQEEPFMVPSALFHPIISNRSKDQIVSQGDGMLLDAPVRIAGNLIGILCINGRNKYNLYSDDELAFVASVGNLVAYYTEADERRLAAEELRQSEERFARAFLDSPLPMLVVSTEKKHILAVNEAWSAVVGYTSEEALGKLPAELGLQSIGERFIAELSGMIASGSPVRNYEVIISSKNGAVREYLLSGSLININGEQCLLLAQQDITDRKRVETELRRSEEFMRRILHSIPDAVYVVALPDFQIIDVNEAFVQVNGITREDIVGKTSREVTALVASGILPLATPDPGSEIIVQDFRKHLLTEGFVSGGYIISLGSQSGRRRRVELSGTKVELENGQQCLCVFERDVTERERVAEALRSAKNAAERANRAKSEFLANMSHEIRTPMNAILGFTEILREQVQNNQHRRYLETINTSSKTLLSLINDILDLSKIEAGKMELQYEQIDVRSLVREVEAIFSLRIQEKSLYFTVSVAPEVPSMLFLDEVRLRQVLFNLVGNAVKFTEQGGVAVDITATTAVNPLVANGNGGASRCCDLTLEVHDTGIGIPTEQITRIFEPFQQQEGQSTRKYGGTGLGLTITRRLTEMMNGTIEVESSAAGSTFRVRLFSVRTGEGRENTADDILTTNDISMNGMTVVVVDDIAANRELLCSHLERFGAKFYEAENGLDAIGLVERYRPDIVFMDIRMPVMDGIEATEILKKQEHTRSIPVVAVTASVMANDTQRLKRLFDGHINKPFTRTELITAIRFVFGGIVDKPTASFAGVSVGKGGDEGVAELENNGDYTALGAELAGEFTERWNEIRKFNRITHIKEFARQLYERATHFGVTTVANYATALREACASFDVKNVTALMAQFPDIVKRTIVKK